MVAVEGKPPASRGTTAPRGKRGQADKALTPDRGDMQATLLGSDPLPCWCLGNASLATPLAGAQLGHSEDLLW